MSDGITDNERYEKRIKKITTDEFLKHYDVGEPSNYVHFGAEDIAGVYKYGAVDILSDVKIMLEKRDKRIKELESKNEIECKEHQESMEIGNEIHNKVIDACIKELESDYAECDKIRVGYAKLIDVQVERIKELEKLLKYKNGEVELVAKLEIIKQFESILQQVNDNRKRISQLSDAVLGYKGIHDTININTITDRIKKELEDK